LLAASASSKEKQVAIGGLLIFKTLYNNWQKKGDRLTVWKYSGKEISFDQIDDAISALENACLHCGDRHSSECPIGKAKDELYNLKCSDKRHVPDVQL
jgi:nitrite reductase/ring-hydroxylating ferredoxin subunit